MKRLDKKQLRIEILKRREELSFEVIQDKSSLIINELIVSPEFKNAKTIGVYCSFGKEIDTQKLIKKFLKTKNICLPRVEGKYINFYLIKSFNDLVKSKLGILEPKPEYLIEPDSIDLLIVPLLAYDLSNYRLGYGGGYYDRYLKNYSNITIGLGLKMFKFPKIVHEQFDIPLQKIIAK